MSEQNTELYQVVVHNKIKDGYRRAGFNLQKGPNLLRNVTAAQLASLKSDPRLVFGSQDDEVTESIEDAEKRLLSENGSNTPKAESDVGDGDSSTDDLTVAQIKEKLTALGVEFKQSAAKAELLELLTQAETIGGE